MMARMRRIRTRIAEYHSVHGSRRSEIQCFSATLGSTRDALVIGESRLQFKKSLIATGARPRTPDIPGLDQIGYCTSDDYL